MDMESFGGIESTTSLISNVMSNLKIHLPSNLSGLQQIDYIQYTLQYRRFERLRYELDIGIRCHSIWTFVNRKMKVDNTT